MTPSLFTKLPTVIIFGLHWNPEHIEMSLSGILYFPISGQIVLEGKGLINVFEVVCKPLFTHISNFPPPNAKNRHNKLVFVVGINTSVRIPPFSNSEYIWISPNVSPIKPIQYLSNWKYPLDKTES